MPPSVFLTLPPLTFTFLYGSLIFPAGPKTWRECPTKRLVVLDNEITKPPDYRLQIAKLLPQLRMVTLASAVILASEDVEMADS